MIRNALVLLLFAFAVNVYAADTTSTPAPTPNPVVYEICVDGSLYLYLSPGGTALTPKLASDGTAVGCSDRSYKAEPKGMIIIK